MMSNLIELRPVEKIKIKRGAKLIYKNAGSGAVEKAYLALTYNRHRDVSGKVTDCNIMMSLKLDYRDGHHGAITYPIEELPNVNKGAMLRILDNVSNELLECPIEHYFNPSDTGGNNKYLVLSELASICEKLIIDLMYRDKERAELINELEMIEAVNNLIRKRRIKRKWILGNLFPEMRESPITENQEPTTEEA